MNKFNELIKLKRMEKNMSLSDVAKLSDMSVSFLSRIEKDPNKNPSIATILKLSGVLDISFKEIADSFDIEIQDINNPKLSQRDSITIEKINKLAEDIAMDNIEYEKALIKIIKLCEQLKTDKIKLIANLGDKNCVIHIPNSEKIIIMQLTNLLNKCYKDAKSIALIEGEVFLNDNDLEFELNEFLDECKNYINVEESNEYLELKKYLDKINY